MDSPEVQAWIHQVLGYFGGCYRNYDVPEGQQWHASRLRIGAGKWTTDPIADHAGVHMIRKYYPEFVPTAEDFANARWGGVGNE